MITQSRWPANSVICHTFVRLLVAFHISVSDKCTLFLCCEKKAGFKGSRKEMCCCRNVTGSHSYSTTELFFVVSDSKWSHFACTIWDSVRKLPIYLCDQYTCRFLKQMIKYVCCWRTPAPHFSPVVGGMAQMSWFPTSNGRRNFQDFSPKVIWEWSPVTVSAVTDLPTSQL